jgi:hypothetical protein
MLLSAVEDILKPSVRNFLVYLVAAWPACAAQTPVSGHWEGGISLPDNTQLQIGVDLYEETQGTWKGDIDIPAQGAQDVPLKDIVVADKSVSFAISVGAGNPRFQGQLSDDATTITGEFIQGASKLAFSIKRSGEARVQPVVKNQPLPEKFAGTWEGTLETPNGNLRLVFHLANSDGAASGTIDSPDQSAIGIPMSEIKATDSTIRITVSVVNGSYDAKLSDDGKVLTGTWSQGGGTLPLALSRK